MCQNNSRIPNRLYYQSYEKSRHISVSAFLHCSVLYFSLQSYSLLLSKTGGQFTDNGFKISNDGGIDGYGYHTDDDDFRTTRVVIQCKRYNIAPVSEPNINQFFLGAMNKF